MKILKAIINHRVSITLNTYLSEHSFSSALKFPSFMTTIDPSESWNSFWFPTIVVPTQPCLGFTHTLILRVRSAIFLDPFQCNNYRFAGSIGMCFLVTERTPFTGSSANGSSKIHWISLFSFFLNNAKKIIPMFFFGSIGICRTHSKST